MAKIGLKRPVYSVLDSPDKKGILGGAISANITWEFAEGELYYDDALGESDRIPTKGILTLNVDELIPTVKADILGHVLAEDGKELKMSASDIAPYVGVGFHGQTKKGGGVSYRAVWLEKVLFGEPDDENSTKSGSIEYGTTTLTGTIMGNEVGLLKTEALFNTEAEAITWLNGKAGIVSTETMDKKTK